MLPGFRRLQSCQRFNPLSIFAYLGVGPGDFLVNLVGRASACLLLTFAASPQTEPAPQTSNLDSPKPVLPGVL
jgi:hypothetical protein